ncbi:MAG: hypothetical protein G01um101448_144 [Parcubacteria group bacterium Gr01-1014_48]|nr:MAG: hypothetical protein Greene041614_99 [Parcubacteria group bacterium Greene0416_14]TSC74417.1 MAG: hypothetical protein G01um101448_144 [Parcubacteria group bacterium Gr01-1014_48]TSD01270.1 MAG: hypothetical protein Greene101415_359 [Parcubacteria group bacterium Greene1014_15]TSD08409.1 MAG: hypothetical protein Greene07144_125 [Parcubacteria group bacterium Greene0714_4]
MTPQEKKSSTQSQRVGFFSRIDYGSPGFRKGLLKALFQRFSEDCIHFAVLVGGLVARTELLDELGVQIERAKQEERTRVETEKRELPKQERRPGETITSIKTRVRNRMLHTWAKDLAEAIPSLKRNGKAVKIYIITSPANTYDGDMGREVAIRLHDLRPDITYWDEGDGRFPLQFRGEHENIDFRAITPIKTPWRSEYYSTGPVRYVKDKQRQSSQDAPSLWVIGCAGVTLHIPQGDYKRPILVLPALNRLKEVHSAENEIGGCVVEFSTESIEPKITTYSLKDLVAFERMQIPDSPHATARQNMILKRFSKGPQTIGMLDRALPSKRSTIEHDINAYHEQKLQPSIIKLPASEKYDIDPRFWEQELQYAMSEREAFSKNSFLAFGCLHAGYPRVQYEWFVDVLPQLILKHDINLLIGAGDYVAGTKHNLVARGEVFRGLNNTKQEKLAAEMVLAVIMKVFRIRFSKIKAKEWRKNRSRAKLKDMVERALLSFNYWQGNHDKWALDESRDPLDTFNMYLADRVRREIISLLIAGRFPTLYHSDLDEIIAGKIVFAPQHTLSSGLSLCIAHPEMGRMTPSGRAQQTMAFLDDGQIIVLANFHVGVALQEWSHTLGERVTIQAPTITSGTAFEDGKNKRCDVGVYIVNVWSRNGRITCADTFFAGPARESMTELSSENDYKNLLADIAKREV